MNTLECWIEDIHSIKPEIINGEEWVVVDITVNCWGSIERKTKEMPKARWEWTVKNGYFVE